MAKYHKAVLPFSVNITVGERVVVTTAPDELALAALVAKFAARLPNQREGAVLLELFNALPRPLQHYWCAGAEGWRLSFSGAILVAGAGVLVEEKMDA